LNILFASSEVAPFAKTGGLADVCGALPVELTRLGHNVAVVMPLRRGRGPEREGRVDGEDTRRPRCDHRAYGDDSVK